MQTLFYKPLHHSQFCIKQVLTQNPMIVCNIKKQNQLTVALPVQNETLPSEKLYFWENGHLMQN